MSTMPIAYQQGSTPQHPVPCPQCQYDLRGTAVDDTCPECGMPVEYAYRGYRVEGKKLIVRDGVHLPARCVKTNQPVDGPGILKPMYYAPPWIFVLILINLLVLVIVYLIVRKKCQFTYYLSAEKKRSRLMHILLGNAAWLGGAGLFIAGFVEESGVLGVSGGVLFLMGLLWAIFAANTLSLTKHKNGEFWVRGCCQEYLDSLMIGTPAPAIAQQQRAFADNPYAS